MTKQVRFRRHRFRLVFLFGFCAGFSVAAQSLAEEFQEIEEQVKGMWERVKEIRVEGGDLEGERRRLEESWVVCVSQERYAFAWKEKVDSGRQVKEALQALRNELVDLNIGLRRDHEKIYGAGQVEPSRSVLYALEEHAFVLTERYTYSYKEYLSALRQYHVMISAYTRACKDRDLAPQLIESAARGAGDILSIISAARNLLRGALEGSSRPKS